MTEDREWLITGDRPVALLRALAAGAQAAVMARGTESRHILQTLRQEGILRQGEATHAAPVQAYWDSSPAPLPATAQLRLHALLTAGDSGLARLLGANGVAMTPAAPMALVAAESYLQPEIEEAAAGADAWLLSKPVGHTVWLGPLFVPGETVCWRCVTYWLRVNRPYAAAAGNRAHRAPPTAALPSTFTLGTSLVATAAAQWLAQGDLPELRNVIQTFDTRTLQWQRHTVRPAPGCPACRAPRQTLPSLVSGVTGIVSPPEETARVAPGFHTSRAAYASPLPVAGARPLVRASGVAGKGRTAEEAASACIAEAAERYSATFQGHEPRVWRRWDELAGAGIAPESLFLFSAEQYRDREALNRERSELWPIPHPFDAARPIDWTAVEPLAPGGPQHWAPTAYCYLWYRAHEPEQPPIYYADSNGCAAGEDEASAQTAALLELIERDALSLWWDAQRPVRGWACEALESSMLRSLRDELQRQGRTLSLLDLTTDDLRVPVCAAVAAKADGSEPYFGAAAAFTAREAAERAAGELVQVLSFGAGQLNAEYRAWLAQGQVTRQTYLQPRELAETPRDLERRGLAGLVDALRAANLTGYTLNLTRPELGIPVVRAIVPGLRHHWGRYAPGRLPAGAMNPIICVL